MKKLNVHEIDWNDIQSRHAAGESLSKLGLSRRMLKLGIDSGLFKKHNNQHKWSDAERKTLSEKRIGWLIANPDKHPWRKSNKFISAPCEQLKEYLRKIGIDFIEEAIVSSEINYAVDILIPSRSLIIEINGNQHYDKYGKLLEYYQNRHDYIQSLGWKILEIHYSLAYNHDAILNLINCESISSSILPFKSKERIIKVKKYKDRNDYFQNRAKLWESENLKLISIIERSDIDFSKFGWVNKVAKLIDKKPQKIKHWMKRMMPDFYENMCFKRK